jgi:frataxin-like iron-binding protein CyaY
MKIIKQMQTFLEFVNVRKHNKEWQFMADGFLPLSPSILKEFEVDVQGVYHVTTIKGLQKLAKLQGKRVDVAGFTKGSRGVAKGLLNHGEILTTLDGKSSVEFQNDVNTRTDRNGIRWLSPNGNVSARLNARIFQFGQKIHPKLIKHFDIPSKGRGSMFKYDVGNWIHDKDGKTKREFIKFYHKEAKKIINSTFIKAINNDIKYSDIEQFNHNEILIHDFKITNSKLIRSSDPDMAEKMWKNAEASGMTKFDVIDQADVEKLK